MPVTLAAWQKVAATRPTTTEDEPTDGDLVARSRTGDLAAFEALYHRYEGAVYRYAVRLLDSPDDADDVRQETFVRAFESLARFRGDARFKTYLLTICGNLCRDRHRSRHRRPEQGYGLELPDGFGFAAEGTCPLAGLEKAADAARVRKALGGLSPETREILLLRHVEELEFDEIARVLGCTRLSVPVRLFRARSRFRVAYLALSNDET